MLNLSWYILSDSLQFKRHTLKQKHIIQYFIHMSFFVYILHRLSKVIMVRFEMFVHLPALLLRIQQTAFTANLPNFQ